MRILHTCDWHIGKIVNEFHMTEDQDFILKQIIQMIKNKKADAVVIAGDIYDRGVPPVEAVELLNKVLSKIVIDLKIPVLAIAGNHDSAERLDFGSDILKSQGLYIESVFKKDIRKVTLNDEYGPVNFYLVPYADPAVVRDVLGDDSIKNFDDAAKAVMNIIDKDIDLSQRNVLVAHGYVVGGNADGDAEKPDTCESERPLSIGGTEYIKADYFKKFNYTALGHLHGAQKVMSDNIRYSGSILKYSFSEVKHKKCVTFVDIDENGDIDVDRQYLCPKRDMKIIKGSMEQLLNEETYKNINVEDYIQVVLTDEGEIMEPMNKLRAVYPNVMQLLNSSDLKDNNADVSLSQDYKTKSKLELFEDFYKNIIGKEFTDEKREIMGDVIEKVEKETRGL